MKHFLIAVFASLSLMLSASAAYDVFIKFEEPSSPGLAVTGDSRDVTYPGAQGWFRVLYFEFGVANTITMGSTSLEAGRSTFENFVISKPTGPGSAAFFQACVMGGRYGKATVVMRYQQGATGSPGPRILQATLHLVMVQSITNSGSDGDQIVEESVTFQYGAHEIQFYTQTEGVEMAAGAPAVWSRITNTPTTATYQ